MTIRAIVHEEDGAYWAEVPGLPGCFTQADSLEELEVNLREAVELYLAPDPRRPVAPTTETMDLHFA